MDINTFWKLIDSVNAKVGHSDQETILQITETALMAFPPQDILDWHHIKDTYMMHANRLDLWAACTATHTHDTDDGFTDFRAWLVSQGKAVYMAALADPDSLADLDAPAGSCSFESYSYVAHGAYAMRMQLDAVGLEAVLRNFYGWTVEHAVEVPIRSPDTGREITEAERAKHFVNAFCQEIQWQYDLYDALDTHPLRVETAMAITAEIGTEKDLHTGRKLRDYLDNIPNALPRLWEKYGTPKAEKSMEGARMDKLDVHVALIKKLDRCYDAYMHRILTFSPDLIFNRADEIAATNLVNRELQNGGYSTDLMEYLLRFENPLEVARDAWLEAQNVSVDDEMTHVLWNLRDKGDAEQDYDLVPDYQPAHQDTQDIHGMAME